MSDRVARTGPMLAAGLALGVAAVLPVVFPSRARADGASELRTLSGCVGMDSYGVGLFGSRNGSLTVDPPGPIVGAYIYWVGTEDATPAGDGTSTLRINGRDVPGTLAAGAAGFNPVASWYSWWANIGPAAGPFPGLGILDDAHRSLNIRGWDGGPDPGTNGATVVVLYDTSPCQIQNQISIQVGVDWYYFGTPGEPTTELLVHQYAPEPFDRRVTLHLSHAGTKHTQNRCRGGAIWLKAGTGPAPGPADFDIVAIAASGRGYGINGGVEVANDPFTGPGLPCTPALNPWPDEAYEPGHPCPGGAQGCAYRGLALRPSVGGDVGAEWAVAKLDVLLPAGSEWLVLQLEAERDQDGESGSWAGTSESVEVSAGCTPPLSALECVDRIACNDPGLCSATLPCDAGAVACSPDPLTVTCAPPAPYPIGRTDVLYQTDTGLEATCAVQVRDCEPPRCSPPPDLLLECTSPCGLPASHPAVAGFLGGGGASDNCSGASVRAEGPDFYASSCAPGSATPVVFRAIDAAGYEATCAAAIAVVDTTPPSIACPAPLRLGCDSGGPVPAGDPRVQAWLATARPTDICSQVSVSSTLPPTLAVGCAPGSPVDVRFTARDACGLESSCSSSIAVVDEDPPAITCPAPLVIECPGPGGVSLADARIQLWLASVRATDACSDPVVSNDAPASFPSACVPGVTRTVRFTARDACGATATCTSSVTVVDRTPPTLTCPAPLVIACPGPGGVPISDTRIQLWLSAARATDSCAVPVVTNDAPAVFPSACSPGLSHTVRFTTSDGCATATCSSTVTVVSPSNPTIACPPPLVIDCPGPGGVPASDPRVAGWLASVSASDVCGTPSLRHDAPAVFPSSCAPGSPRTINFTATGGCGSATCSSTVTVRDATGPTITCPAPLELSCEEAFGISASDPRIQAWLASATATDGCGQVRLSHAAPDRFPPGCSPGLATPVTFFADDDCGLRAACVSAVNVVDRTPPLITCPDPLTIGCTSPGGVPASDDRIRAWLASARASDLCGGDAALSSNRPDFFPAGCSPGHDTQVAWVAADRCGNTATCDSILTVEDTPPEILPCSWDRCVWPPNHDYVCIDNVSLQATVVEPCGDPTASVTVLCESSQCDDAPCPEHPGEDGDGVTTDDCTYDPVLDRVCFRSERAGSDPRGRYYTISFQAIDSCGAGQPSVGMRFWIPHDQEDAPFHCIVSDANDRRVAEQPEDLRHRPASGGARSR